MQPSLSAKTAQFHRPKHFCPEKISCLFTSALDWWVVQFLLNKFCPVFHHVILLLIHEWCFYLVQWWNLLANNLLFFKTSLSFLNVSAMLNIKAGQLNSWSGEFHSMFQYLPDEVSWLIIYMSVLTIVEHLTNNHQCVMVYQENMFSLLSRSHHTPKFKFKVLETIFIKI